MSAVMQDHAFGRMALKGVEAGGIVRIYKRGPLRCRPYDQGNARSLKQWDGDEYGSRAFFIANQL